MPRRRNSDLGKVQASTNTVCPHCGVRIEPKDYKRVDWEHLECPHCGKQFIVIAKIPMTAGVGIPIEGLPFDVDEFFRRLRYQKPGSSK